MSENISPLVDQNRPHTVWHKSEIYTGPTGTGQYVPRVEDLVYELINGVVVWYSVSDLNIESYISTLVPAQPIPNGTLTEDDVALGISPAALPQIYFAYIDKSVVPYNLAIDGRFPIYGSDIVSCKIFAGTDTTAAGRVISAVYDSGGDFVGENAQMELVANDTYNNNIGVKTMAPCKTSANLADGERVTAVFYYTNGTVAGKQQFLVENTRYIRRAGASVRTVTGIKLQSPWLSTINAKTIVFPHNLTLEPENLTGVVVYNDGQEVPMPVDGEKFIVEGLDAYDAQATGISFPLVLKYMLSSNEQAYGGVGGEEHISEEYTLVTAGPNFDYEVRLFPFPRWVSALVGYRLSWWLLDGSRSVAQDVTNLVAFAAGSAAFNGINYGVKQTIRVIINMAQVSGNYNSYNHLQEVDIRLLAPGTHRQNLALPPNWLITPTAGSNPMFGQGVFATFLPGVGSLKTFQLKGNFTTLNDWLQAYYYNSLPLVLSPGEDEAPEPTGFTLVINGAEFPFELESWNQPLSLSATCNSNDTVYVRFQYAGQQLLELGVAGMPLYQVNENGSYA